MCVTTSILLTVLRKKLFVAPSHQPLTSNTLFSHSLVRYATLHCVFAKLVIQRLRFKTTRYFTSCYISSQTTCGHSCSLVPYVGTAQLLWLRCVELRSIPKPVLKKPGTAVSPSPSSLSSICFINKRLHHRAPPS